jgi:D-glycero-D-manno-heptose 1,7-bisphosphate phosphatase
MDRNVALFLDRDGVINVDHGYVCSADRTDFIDGIFDLVRLANENGYLVIVITNQAGIARGYYTEEQFQEYMSWMRSEFVRHDAKIDSVFHCPHHPTEGVGEYWRKCSCRKPAPGMILDAQRQFALDLSRSIFVGDKDSDMQAGMAAGVGLNLLLGGRDFHDLHEVGAFLKERSAT